MIQSSKLMPAFYFSEADYEQEIKSLLEIVPGTVFAIFSLYENEF
jgi:hypothetical protein